MIKLSVTPRVWDASDAVSRSKSVLFTEGNARGNRPSGVEPIWYESERYQNRPTRVFGWLGIPDCCSAKKLPAVVLVHGGGGTAFAHWVKMWNQRGYAAIAMDTCGNIPCARKYGMWQRHGHGGPDHCDVFERVDLPLKQQWPYHAVAAVVRAHSLLRSLPEVDDSRIAICGVSWGGYLTSLTIGVDQRFRCAVSIYGCGFLDEESAWQKDLGKLGPERKAKWLKNWDPCVYLPHAKLPTLWVTGSNDSAYNLNMLDMSHNCHGGERSLSIGLRYRHSHAHGWKRPETAAFIDGICRGDRSLIRVLDSGHTGSVLYARYGKRIAPRVAWLCYTTGKGKWPKRHWRRRKAVIENGIVTSQVPLKMTACFFNLVNSDGCTSSSSLIYPEQSS